MISIFNTLLLTFLEMTFVMVGIILLYSQRKHIGVAPFYTALGMLLVLGQLISGADLRFNDLDFFGSVHLNFQIAPIVIFMPLLTAMMMVYATEGVLALQRLIIGFLVVLGLFFYLGDLTRLQSRWLMFTLSTNMPLEAFDLLLENSRRLMLVTVGSQLLQFFLIPVVFSRMRNAGHWLFNCCFGALLVVLVVDSGAYLLFAPSTQSLSWWDNFYSMLTAKFVATMWLSTLLTIYISRFGEESTAHRARPLEIVFAFFGGYGRSKLLEANLLEWEGRYRMILENASEMILIVDPEGQILDTNLAAGKLLGYAPDQLIHCNFGDMLKTEQGKPFLLDSNVRDTSLPVSERTMRAKALIQPEHSEQMVYLALTITPVVLRGLDAYIVMGRDVTEETLLAEEKAHLQEDLAHSQRLEALGQLAGGIAHDFNNNIHAILGHVDLLAMEDDLSEDAQRHLGKVADIAVQSGKLTSQLLGFARKGKYQETDFDLRILLRKSVDFLTPGNKEIDIDVQTPSVPNIIRGDQIQLQQVILNLLINARDSMQNVTVENKMISIWLGEATDVPESLLPHDLELENFYAILIQDNGCGMNEKTRKRLFEPFFTTKPVGQGTGMGLAMAYGTITNHKGRIQVQSTPGKGSTFAIFLPKING